MKSKQQIQQEVEKTLNSLDGIQRAAANPYLFTRIKAALQKEEKSVWTVATGFISKPVVALAMLILAILINAAVLFNTQSNSEQNGTSEELLAGEYSMTATTFFDSNEPNGDQ